MWVYNLKEDVDESLEYRACWVACDDSQVLELEFEETFVTSNDFIIVKIIAALSANQRSTLITLDITSVYLNSSLFKSIYVEYPIEFFVSEYHQFVYKLNRALYDLETP